MVVAALKAIMFLIGGIKNPNQMKCRYCGTVFPNEQYQEDQHIEGRNERGELITFPYHFNVRKRNVIF